MELYTKKLGKVAVTVEKDPYDSTKEYDKLTIVTTPTNCYISRVFVPAGTNIDNTEYWCKLQPDLTPIIDRVNEIENAAQNEFEAIQKILEEFAEKYDVEPDDTILELSDTDFVIKPSPVLPNPIITITTHRESGKSYNVVLYDNDVEIARYYDVTNTSFDYEISGEDDVVINAVYEVFSDNGFPHVYTKTKTIYANWGLYATIGNGRPITNYNRILAYRKNDNTQKVTSFPISILKQSSVTFIIKNGTKWLPTINGMKVGTGTAGYYTSNALRDGYVCVGTVLTSQTSEFIIYINIK